MHHEPGAEIALDRPYAMPIEIRELHIRVTVGEGARQDRGPAPPATATSPMDKDALIAECVEQVMQILHSKKER